VSDLCPTIAAVADPKASGRIQVPVPPASPDMRPPPADDRQTPLRLDRGHVGERVPEAGHAADVPRMRAGRGPWTPQSFRTSLRLTVPGEGKQWIPRSTQHSCVVSPSVDSRV